MRLRTTLPRSLSTAAILLLAIVSNAVASAEKYAAAELKEAAPDSLASEVRDTLGKTGYRVTDSAGKTIADVWLRSELPVIEKFQEQGDMKYPIEPGTLVGAIRFPTANSDYRRQKIKAGVYTLRYGHQPQDGNHLGTANYRDFVMLSPAAEDKSVGTIEQDKVTEISKKAAGTTHPAIMSLLPPQKGRDKLPTMAHEDTLDLHVLVTKISTQKGAPIKELQIELVTIGHAPE